ncbi:MAG: adenylyltransferase/cytidyltransferase family protein [Candidatus Micrarchaeota archaeon]
MPKARKAMAFGAFDVLHLGHISFLEQAAALAETLVVVVATDKVIRKVKGRAPYFNQEERLKLVSSLRCVGKAILGDEGNTVLPIVWEKPDVIALGYDQPKKIGELRKEVAEVGLTPRIVRLKPFGERRHKSSKVKAYFERFV